MRRCLAYHTRFLFIYLVFVSRCIGRSLLQKHLSPHKAGCVHSDARAAVQKQLGSRKVSRSHVAHPPASGGAAGEFIRWLARSSGHQRPVFQSHGRVGTGSFRVVLLLWPWQLRWLHILVAPKAGKSHGGCASGEQAAPVRRDVDASVFATAKFWLLPW